MIDPRHHPLRLQDYIFWGIFIFVSVAASQLILSLVHLTERDQTNFIQSVALEKRTVVSRAVFRTSLGDIVIRLDKKNAPITVANFTQLVAAGFYDGTKFHRVVDGVLLQGGDPLSRESDRTLWGTGGAGYVFEDENVDGEITRGTIAMANNGRANTNSSQFIIITASSAPQLEGKYSVFGAVAEGLDVVEKIMARGKDERGFPTAPVVIRSVTLK